MLIHCDWQSKARTTSGSRYNLLLESELEKMRPNAGPEGHVPFQHTLVEKRAGTGSTTCEFIA
jgi:hypothetical protein